MDPKNERGWVWGCLAFVGIIAIIGLVLGAIALSQNGEGGQIEEHTYCFEARDANFVNDDVPPPADDDDDQNVAVGRVRVDNHHLCWKLQYLMLDGCALDVAALFGPVDYVTNGNQDGPAVTVFPDDDLNADHLSGCAHIDHVIEQAIIDDPQDYYVAFNFTGGHPYCDKIKVRTHLTGLCRTDSATDDDYFHHHHSHGKGKGGGGHHHDDDDDSHFVRRKEGEEAETRHARLSHTRD